MSALQRVTTHFHVRRRPRLGATYPTRVIPGPFMMGWVVDVPRSTAAGRTTSGGGRDE